MSELLVNFIGTIGAISLIMGSCLGALLIFWKQGKKDIKEYLNGKEKNNI